MAKNCDDVSFRNITRYTSFYLFPEEKKIFFDENDEDLHPGLISKILRLIGAHRDTCLYTGEKKEEKEGGKERDIYIYLFK